MIKKNGREKEWKKSLERTAKITKKSGKTHWKNSKND